MFTKRVLFVTAICFLAVCLMTTTSGAKTSVDAGPPPACATLEQEVADASAVTEQILATLCMVLNPVGDPSVQQACVQAEMDLTTTLTEVENIVTLYCEIRVILPDCGCGSNADILPSAPPTLVTVQDFQVFFIEHGAVAHDAGSIPLPDAAHDAR
jgi:hypothetical protein